MGADGKEHCARKFYSAQRLRSTEGLGMPVFGETPFRGGGLSPFAKIKWQRRRPAARSSGVRSRYRVNDPEGAHFVTSTIVDWLPVFTTAACCDILVGSFDYCRKHKQMRLYAWVVMENHFHAIVSAQSLSAVMNDLKKFTARSLLKQVRREGRLGSLIDWSILASRTKRVAVTKCGRKAFILKSSLTMR
jgi:REP element-mobilizing transposase RayT